MLLLRRLALARDGVSAAEFALALPVLMLLLFPAIDFALAFSMQLRLTAAATRAAELVTGTGRVLPSYDFLATEAQAGAPGSTATVTNWLECNGVAQTNSSGVCPGGVRFARYVRVRVNDTYQPLFRLGPLVGAPVALQGQATVRVQ